MGRKKKFRNIKTKFHMGKSFFLRFSRAEFTRPILDLASHVISGSFFLQLGSETPNQTVSKKGENAGILAAF